MSNESCIKHFLKVSIAHLFLCFAVSSHASDKHLTKSLLQEKTYFKAYQQVLAQHPSEALLILDKASGKYPAHEQYIRSLSDVMLILIKGEKKIYDSLYINETNYLKELGQLSKKDPYKLFVSAEIRIQWALVKVMFGDELKAGWSLKSAYSEIETNMARFPTFQPNNKSMGVLKVLFSAMPEEYHWLLNLFGIAPNGAEGWHMLHQIDIKNPYATETALIRSMMAVNILNDLETAFKELQSLRTQLPNHPVIEYLTATALIKNAKSQSALPILIRLSSKLPPLPNYNVYYRLADVYMQKQSYDSARIYFNKYLNLYNGQNCVKDASFKIAVSHHLEGQAQRAFQYWIQARQSGSTVLDVDKNAHYMLSANRLPQPELLKVRYATDGGFFKLAQESLEKIKPNQLTNPSDQAEYVYRKARLGHKQGQIQQAISDYQQTIHLAGDSPWYFAPSACLNLGYLYAQLKENDHARMYFEQVLTYKKHQYKRSLDNQANAALQLLAQ